MNQHVSAEALSLYLDGELAPAAGRALASHLAGCAHCRSRLEATRRAVLGLRHGARATPPAALAERVRRQVALAAQADGRGWLRDLRHPVAALRGLRAWASDLPLRPALATPLGVGLALMVCLLLAEHGQSWKPYGPAPRPVPVFHVEESFGDSITVVPQTTSEVAGRVFVLSDDVWVQRGLDSREPQARVSSRSREGRALLAKFSDLGFLLADGSRVVLRYNLETLELSNGAS
ncbi:MAG TPA: zf-HC2 domain-containing protein [Thermoanaerobaculia bacterium]|nr:zf-HC2 domain-containing protein [Thermoanaerobaculia bacterium]